MEIIGAIHTYMPRSIMIALPIYIIIKITAYFFKRKGHDSSLNLLIEFIFIVYLVATVHLTVGLQVFELAIPKYFFQPNFIPFIQTITDMNANFNGVLVQVIYNICLFIPFGILLPMVFKKQTWSFLKIIIVGFITSLVIEILQFFTGRFCDIDDVIVNTIGTLAGFAIYSMIRYLYKKRIAGLHKGENF